VTHAEFIELFPTADACLEYLKARRYPDGNGCPACRRPTRFHRIKGRSSYSCQFCGTHVYPTAGTIFHKSSTSLQLWFWAILLIGSTHGSITVRQLERELEVTYKTDKRMRERIGRLILDDDRPADTAPRPVPTPAWRGGRRRAGAM
jgi:transposase